MSFDVKDGSMYRSRTDLTEVDYKHFAETYMETLDCERAAASVGINPNAGKRLLGHDNIQRYIRVLRARQADRTELYSDEVLRRIWILANADVRDIQEIWNCNCRYCNGFDHRYQFTENELRDAVEAHHARMMLRDEAKRVPFDDRGGGNFDRYAKPNKNCPECRGRGVPQLVVHDSRGYSEAAAALYNGVEVDPKSGKLSIKMRDRNWAMDKVAGHVLGNPVQRHAVTVFDPTQMSDDQLDAAIESIRKLLPVDKTIDMEENGNVEEKQGQNR